LVPNVIEAATFWSSYGGKEDKADILEDEYTDDYQHITALFIVLDYSASGEI